MDKYIKQLLEQYSKVILPKFGAIVIEDEESGELMFNEYLNYNDGKLDELIESESNMGTQEAQNMIAKYIRDIQAQIDKGESYDIFGLGSFIKNKDGEVEFSGNIKTGTSKKSSEPAGPSPTPAQSKKEEKAPEKKADKKEEKSAAPKSETKENKYVAPAPDTKKEQVESDNKKEVKKPEDKTEKTEKKAVEKKQDSKANKDKAKKEKEASKKKAKEDKEKAKKDKQKAKEDAKKAKADKKKKAAATTKNKTDQKEEGKKKKKKVGVVGWIAIVLLLIIATGSILVGLNYEEVKIYMGWDEFKDNKELVHNDISPSTNETNDEDLEDDNTESDAGEEDLESSSENESNDPVEENESENENEENEGNSESSSEDQENIEEKEPVVEEPVKEEPVEETPVVSNTSSGSYHLIAGGYREKSNAEDAVSELRSKGLDAKIIGRINGLHFVSAKSYNSLNAAKLDMNNVRSKAPGAWIYKQ
tara:strand:+ start:25355 stop:26782 length:1428 start_codon:yes stop_codon:yes gene_type:complete